MTGPTSTSATGQEGRAETLCSSPYYVPGESVWHCSLRPGHRGEHEDESGHWWPREDQLETW